MAMFEKLNISFVILLLLSHVVARQRQFHLELTWRIGAPDGFEREMIFINGQYPGPLLEVAQGDWVEMNVVNNMPFNTTLHGHGIEQLNTPGSDGVPGLSQRPIRPGSNFTYRWHASQYGSYFYHAHSRGQIDDGCYGPIIIRPKPGIAKPFEMIAPAEVDLLEAAERTSIPLVLSDWRHKTSEVTWDLQVASGIESAVCMDSILVNGRGSVDCWSREKITQLTNPALVPILQPNGLNMTDKGCVPPPLIPLLVAPQSETNISSLPPEIFEVCSPTQGSQEITKVPCDAQWLALDIISTAGLDAFAFSIDEHPLWVYAVDGHYIEPLKVDVLTVSNGDRYSVFIKLDRPAKNYGIRVASVALAQLIDTTAILSYENRTDSANGNSTFDIVDSTPSINPAGVPLSPNVTIFNQSQMISFPPQFPQPAPNASQTFILDSTTVGKSYLWSLNNTIYNRAIDNAEPPLLYQDPDTISAGDNITITTRNNTWVDLVFRVMTLNHPPHPIHKHSNKAFIIGQGEGNFTWSSVAEAAAEIPEAFNLVTPPYRDGFVTLPTVAQPTWLAVRYHVVNPGAFLLHCHIQSHLNGGMAMVILDGVDHWPTQSEYYTI